MNTAVQTASAKMRWVSHSKTVTSTAKKSSQH